MVIDHEVYLSYKKGNCSNAKALSLIQLNMADLPQCCLDFSALFLDEIIKYKYISISFVNNNHQ